MLSLLRLITLRHLIAERSRTLLTLTGVALGVSVYLAIRLANQSVIATFQSSIDSIAGRTTLQIRGESLGFDENLIRQVRREPGISHLAPIIETPVAVEELPGETLLVLGIDPLEEKPLRSYKLTAETEGSDLFRLLQEPTSILLSQPFSERHGIRVGDSLTLIHNEWRHPITVIGILQAEGPAKADGGILAFMDISTAQWLFDKLGRLDRIDLVTDPDQPVEEIKTQLQRSLPPYLTVQRPERRTAQVEGILHSFQLNLTITGGIALLVALFLVHNTMTLAIAKRRKEIGLLRSLGVTRPRILSLMALEGLILGGVGSLLGTGLGLFLARWTLQAVSTTVSSLYLPIRGEALQLAPPLILEGIFIGMGVSLLAVLSPAVEASRTLPRETLQSGFFEKKPSFPPGLRTILGLSFLLISSVLALQHVGGKVPITGYLAAFFLLLGSLLLVPITTLLLHHGLTAGRTTTSLSSLALNNLTSSLQRTTSAVTPLLVALALMVGILVMVHSFRKTVEHWIQETIRADLVVVPAAWEMQGSEASLPEERIEELARLPGVLAADGYREIRINLGEEPVLLVARDLTIHNRFSQYLFLKGDSHQILEAASRGEGLLISEPLSLRFRLHRGDTLPLETPNGHLALPILGIFHDYSTDGGRLLMDRKLYRHYWPHDNRISVVALYLAPDTTPEETREALLQHPLGNQMATINHRDLKEGILNIFDQTFAITYALELIAMVVGVLGIFNTLLTSILERKRELGILRAIGMSRLQLVIMILYEGGFIGIIGCLLGGSAGMGLSWLLIAVINKQAFGWTIHFEPFPDLLGIICLLVLIIAILASLIPARRAMALQIAEAVHYE